MALARNRQTRQVDYWPGFVDALSTLLLSIMFLLSVFVLAQYLLFVRNGRRGRGDQCEYHALHECDL